MMRKLIFTIFLILPVISQAGFWSSVIGGGTVGYIAGKSASSTCQIIKEKSRAEMVNNYLWEMHKKGIYEDNYKFYLDFLEKSEEYKNSLHTSDTVAWVYFDFEDYKKSLDIYEKDILPWIQFEERESQERYIKIHKLFKEREACFINCDEIVIRAKEIDLENEEIIDSEAKTKTERANELLIKSQEGLSKLGSSIKDKARDIADSQAEKLEN